MGLALETILNGNVLGSKSCSFFIDLVPTGGILACSYEETLESDDVYDDSKDGGPIGSTAGKYAVTGFQLTFLRNAWNAIGPVPGVMQRLALKGALAGAPGSYGAARFDFVAEYSEPIAPMHTVVDAMAFCRIVGVKDDYAEGIEKLVTVVSLKCLRMARNGLTLFSPTRQFL